MAFDIVELAAEAQGIDPEIAAQMEQDAQAWKKQGRDTNLDDDTPAEPSDMERDEKGRFTSQEPEGKPDAELTGDAEAKGDDKKASQPAEKPQAKEQSTETKKDEAEKQQQQEQGKSKWAREQERKARTWEEVNKTKAEIQAERDQLKLEREQFEAQQKTLSGQVKDDAGFTAAQYQDAAAKFASQAQAMRQRQLEAEARGDFEAAEKLENEANRNDTLAKNAGERAGAMSATGPNAAWSRLAQDLPEALQRDSQMFAELRKAIRGNPALLADPFGPYRAAVQIGRKTLGETQAALSKAQADAAQVPKLTKQVEELTAKVKELTRLTSLTGDGGIISREGSEGRRFEDLSLAEMEAQLAGHG